MGETKTVQKRHDRDNRRKTPPETGEGLRPERQKAAERGGNWWLTSRIQLIEKSYLEKTTHADALPVSSLLHLIDWIYPGRRTPTEEMKTADSEHEFYRNNEQGVRNTLRKNVCVCGGGRLFCFQYFFIDDVSFFPAILCNFYTFAAGDGNKTISFLPPRCFEIFIVRGVGEGSETCLNATLLRFALLRGISMPYNRYIYILIEGTLLEV